MRTTLRITAIAIAAWLSGCVDTPAPVISIPDPDVASRSMTPDDARAILKNAAGLMSFPRGSTRITGIDLIDDQVLVFIQENGDRSETLPVSALIVTERIFDGRGKVTFTADHLVVLRGISADVAGKVADALVVIKLAPVLKEQQVVLKQRQIEFETQAQSYRDATVKPLPGEDVRRYRVQAEAAVSQKRFQDAANLYAKALHIAPWWPEGHFNAALILAELDQYDNAIDHMRKYLALVPNAPDARAAQDKIYAWEGEKAAHPQASASTTARGGFVK